MSTFNRSMSLVERKKLQWAKEREELASLCAPWGPPDQDSEKTLGRARYESKLSMVHNGYLKRDYKENTRRGSLPPLYKNQYNSYDRYEREKELGGETSGYGSDNPNQTPDCVPSNWHQSGYESSSSRDDRPKWGDKGVGVGKFWQPKEEHFDKNHNEPPNWVKRGLEDGEIVVSNTSPAESPEQRYEEHERPYTGSSFSNQRNTYIRGQNIPIDSVELAERERRRQIAMAHQEAIRQQLEDRERRRREEREKRIKEEHEEELRIEREQEIERQRKENELRLIREKQERERRRKEAIQEAIALAQKAAEVEKSKKLNKQSSINKNIVDNVTEKDKILTVGESIPKETNDVNDNQKEDEKKKNCEQLNNTRNVPSRNEILNNEINNNLEITGKNIESPRSAKEHIINNKPPTPRSAPKENCNIQSYNNNNNTNILNNSLPFTQLYTPRAENLALVIQTPLDALQTVQYALLVPATPQTIPIAVPITTVPQTDRSCNTSRTENRILTPTQYRNRNRRTCDSATQTEDYDFGRYESADNKEKYIREKLTNIELTYDNRNRKGRRSRSESLEERPKWGANRPPTRYLKQSEKDPLYQRRKLRQKMRDNKTYDDKNSSDESQTAATPRSYRRKSYTGERNSRSLWRKNDQLFTRNIRMYQTEIVPLESDKDQIYYRRHECCCVCRCEKRNSSGDNIKVDILRIEQISPRENLQYKAEMLESSERLPDCTTDGVSDDILDRLSSLHNGLLQKQEQWEHCPTTPNLSPHNKN